VLQASDETRHINVEGSRNVFEAAGAAGAKRLVYASSVAAYGFPQADGRLTEDLPARDHERHPYSAHKAEVEGVLTDALAGADIDAYVFRPCIVAGPRAPALVNQVPTSAGATCCPARSARCSCCPTRASSSSSSTTTTWPPRCAPASSGAVPPARTTWPARAS
jgi:hypothetical protein